MLANELKESLIRKVDSAYFIFGEDSYLRGEALSALTSLVQGDFEEFNLTNLDGATCTVSDIVDAMGQVPFMSERRVVVVRDFDKSVDDKEYALISSNIKKLEGCTVVFVRSSGKERAKANDIARLCTPVDCSSLTESEVVEYIENYCATRGYTINRGASLKIAKYTSLDLARVNGELNKLTAYTAETKIISDTAVDEIVSRDIEFVVYALANAVSERNAREAYKLLEQGKCDSGKSLGMLTALLNQFRRMLHVLLNKGLPPVLLATHLGVKEFVVTKTLNLAMKFKQVRLKAIVDKLESLEYDFKSGRLADANDALFSGVAFALSN